MQAKWNDKKLGFGLMRLPMKDDKIDIAATCELADAFIANGFTYFDTAYVYPGSEDAFREAVVKRHPRESYTAATKMAAWLFNDTLTAEAMLSEQLERCGLEYFDYYLLHSLQASRVEIFDKHDCWSFCRQKKQEGKIRNYGFSYHGDPVLLDKLLTDHPDVDFVQLQLNYVDWDDNVVFARENYEVCRKHNKDIVVMEPVKGGILAKIKPELTEKFRALDPDASAASYALRFVGSLPGVKMVLSGMNTKEQLTDNMKIFSSFVPLRDEEYTVIREVTESLRSTPTIPCTDCRYCVKGCPMEINIPDIIKASNLILTFGDHSRPHFYYSGLLATGSGKAGSCVECGQCEAACPQHIHIIERLKQASGWLDV